MEHISVINQTQNKFFLIFISEIASRSNIKALCTIRDLIILNQIKWEETNDLMYKWGVFIMCYNVKWLLSLNIKLSMLILDADFMLHRECINNCSIVSKSIPKIICSHTKSRFPFIFFYDIISCCINLRFIFIVLIGLKREKNSSRDQVFVFFLLRKYML